MARIKKDIAEDVEGISSLETPVIPETEPTGAIETEKTTEYPGKYIYAGVSLPGIKSNTVFSGKIPEKLNIPFIRELVIPVEKYPEFIKRKAVTSSREAYCYRKSAEYADELKK